MSKKIMNIYGKIFIISIFYLALGTLISCTKSNEIEYGTYVNESNDSETLIINEDYIQFFNVNFDDFNDDLQKDFGVDFNLTNKLCNENSYTITDKKISIELMMGISVQFEFKEDYIIVNHQKFLLEG
ncbi:MAG: hypothetical protein AB7U79_05265 [Candidatus Izemoplasmatales bacterium]